VVQEVVGSRPIFHPTKKPSRNAGLFLFNTLDISGDALNIGLVIQKKNVRLILVLI
jgi:hypothetical protein